MNVIPDPLLVLGNFPLRRVISCILYAKSTETGLRVNATEEKEYFLLTMWRLTRLYTFVKLVALMLIWNIELVLRFCMFIDVPNFLVR